MIATLLNQASAAQTTSGVSNALLVRQTPTLAVDINVSAVSGTSPTLNFVLERLGAVGVWYSVGWAPSQITAVGTASTSVGPGCATNAVLTGQVRLRWTIGGTTPSFTFSASIIGRAIADT